MESLWTHSNCNAVLAAVDVVVAEASPEDESVNSKSVRFALVRIPAESDNVSMPPMKSKPAEDRSTSCPRQVFYDGAKTYLKEFIFMVCVISGCRHGDWTVLLFSLCMCR
jgi:hypothetical protein